MSSSNEFLNRFLELPMSLEAAQQASGDEFIVYYTLLKSQA